MSIKEQAEAVLNSKAYKDAFAETREVYLDHVLHAQVGTDELMIARMRYDALIDFHSTLESKMRSRE